MMSPFPPHIIASIGRFFVCTAPSEEHAIKEIMEEYLKGKSRKRISQTAETRKNSINAVCTNAVLRMSMKIYLSDTASYEKRVCRDCMFTTILYYKLISKNAINNREDQDQKLINMNEERHELVKMIPKTM